MKALSSIVALCLAGVPHAPAADGPSSCDRACLVAIGDDVLASMASRDATALPLARDYAATENLVPSVPAMMTSWRTTTAVEARRYFVDPSLQQLFLVATIAEGGSDALLYGRIGVRDRRITELELYVNRSRGQSGFLFDPAGPAQLPDAWTVPVNAGCRPTRAELLAAGRSMFDPTLSAPPADPACTVVETGQVAHLSEVMQSTVTRASAPQAAAASASRSVAVSCDAVPHRPPDPDARTVLVDEEQGVVVGMATVRGIASSYLLGSRLESNFLPDGYYARYRPLQDRQRALAPDVPALRPMPTSASVTQIYRVYDGRIQGFQRFILVMPPGTVSPWTAAGR